MSGNSIETFRELIRNDATLAAEVDRIITSGRPVDLIRLGESRGLKFTWEQLRRVLHEDSALSEARQTATDSNDLTAREVTIISAQYTSPLDDAVRKAEQREAAKQIVQQT